MLLAESLHVIPANIIIEIRVWIFQNYRDCRYTCNPHDDYMHVTGNTLRHRDSLHFLRGKHLQCRLVQCHWHQQSRECFYIAEFLQTGNSKIQWNQSKKISYVTEKVCCHMDMCTKLCCSTVLLGCSA